MFFSRALITCNNIRRLADDGTRYNSTLTEQGPSIRKLSSPHDSLKQVPNEVATTRHQIALFHETLSLTQLPQCSGSCSPGRPRAEGEVFSHTDIEQTLEVPLEHITLALLFDRTYEQDRERALGESSSDRPPPGGSTTIKILHTIIFLHSPTCQLAEGNFENFSNFLDVSSTGSFELFRSVRHTISLTFTHQHSRMTRSHDNNAQISELRGSKQLLATTPHPRPFSCQCSSVSTGLAHPHHLSHRTEA